MTGRSRLVTLFILLCPVTLLLAWQYHARYPVLDHIYAARPGWRPCADLSAYSRGRWAPRIAAKATSVFDLGFKQNTSDALHKLECRPLNSKVSWAQFGTLTQDAEDLDIELRHVVDVHNYAFAPDRCPLRPFDPAAFVAYLLRSPRGMFLVGDSLAGQHLAGIQMLLGVLDTTSDAEALVVTKGNPATFFANAAHPGVHALRHSYSEADWADRLQHPVITFRWTSHLASNAMLVDALKEAGVPKSVGRSPERYPGYRDADWYGPIAEALRGDGPSVDGSTPTLLVLNSGPHWSTRHLDGLDGMEYDKAGPIIQQVYKAAAHNITSTLNAMPGSDRLRIVYRTNPPVPENCRLHLVPATDLPEGSHLYNYDLFQPMDLAWKDAGAEILNITYMVGLRPDARRDPSHGDCMHSCIPVAAAYTEALWSTMY